MLLENDYKNNDKIRRKAYNVNNPQWSEAIGGTRNAFRFIGGYSNSRPAVLFWKIVLQNILYEHNINLLK